MKTRGLSGAAWLLGAIGCVLAADSAQPVPKFGNREQAFVAATSHFRFHSDFWLNLHDYLYGIAGGGPFELSGFDEEGSACFDSRRVEQAAGWQAAVRYYRDHMGERHHRRDPLMRSVRYLLTDLAAEEDPDPQRETVLGHLRGAAAAYRACLWEEHDARNRRRIAELVGLLVIHDPSIQAELVRH